VHLLLLYFDGVITVELAKPLVLPENISPISAEKHYQVHYF